MYTFLRNISVLCATLLIICSASYGYAKAEKERFYIAYVEPNDVENEQLPKNLNNGLMERDTVTFHNPKGIYYIGYISWYDDRTISFHFRDKPENHAYVESAKSYLLYLLQNGIGGDRVKLEVKGLEELDTLVIPEFFWGAVKEKFNEPNSRFALLSADMGELFEKSGAVTGLFELASGINNKFYEKFSSGGLMVNMEDDQGRQVCDMIYPGVKIYLSGYGEVTKGVDSPKLSVEALSHEEKEIKKGAYEDFWIGKKDRKRLEAEKEKADKEKQKNP